MLPYSLAFFLNLIVEELEVLLLISMILAMHAEKFVLEEKTERLTWELTNPVPLDDEGSPVEAILGQNPDVHYIYICIKVSEQFLF